MKFEERKAERQIFVLRSWQSQQLKRFVCAYYSYVSVEAVDKKTVKFTFRWFWDFWMHTHVGLATSFLWGPQAELTKEKYKRSQVSQIRENVPLYKVFHFSSSVQFLADAGVWPDDTSPFSCDWKLLANTITITKEIGPLFHDYTVFYLLNQAQPLFSHNFKFQMNTSVEEQAPAFWNKIFTKHSKRDRYVILSASGPDYKFFFYVTFQG